MCELFSQMQQRLLKNFKRKYDKLEMLPIFNKLRTGLFETLYISRFCFVKIYDKFNITLYDTIFYRYDIKYNNYYLILDNR
jgi:hypothetical protein